LEPGEAAAEEPGEEPGEPGEAAAVEPAVAETEMRLAPPEQIWSVAGG
jgi:hypothetical protein